MLENIDDKILIQRYFQGDEKALEFLIERYLKQVYGFLCRYTGNLAEAEDITQEVFVRVWCNLKKFDQQKSFKTWLFAIAKNAAIDYLKKKKSIPFSALEDEEGNIAALDELVDPAPLPDEILARADVAGWLNSVLAKLSLADRLVLTLYYKEQFNLREVAEILNESVDTVKSRHRRALLKLRNILSP